MEDLNLSILFGATFLVIYLVLLIFGIVTMWKLYLKASKPGWASIVPIYSYVIYMEIIGRPVWWILLLFIPIVNLVISIIILYDFLKSYGKDGLGFFFGTLFLPFIFLPILAFGNAKYIGPSVKESLPPNSQPMPPTAPPAVPKDPNTL